MDGCSIYSISLGPCRPLYLLLQNHCLFRSCPVIGHIIILLSIQVNSFDHFLCNFLSCLFTMLCIAIYYKLSAVSDNKHELIKVIVAANITTHKTSTWMLLNRPYAHSPSRLLISLLCFVPLIKDETWTKSFSKKETPPCAMLHFDSNDCTF